MGRKANARPTAGQKVFVLRRQNRAVEKSVEAILQRKMRKAVSVLHQPRRTRGHPGTSQGSASLQAVKENIYLQVLRERV
jgi:hypothetical protein